MPVRTLSQRTSLVAVGGELRYTTSRLIAHEEGAPYVAEFQGLCQKGTLVQNQEQSLRDKVTDAQAVVDHVDDLIDAFVKKFMRALDGITNNDRKHPLVQFYLGKKTPSDFAKPVLGPQLQEMANWLPSLQSSEHPSLKSLEPELADLVAKGKAAAKGKTDAELARDHFRDVGERYKFIEEVNAKRKTLYGNLAKRPHENEALPQNFADRFFRREPRGNDDEPSTIEEIDEAIAGLSKQISGLQDARAAMVLEAEKVAKGKIKEHEETLAALAKKKAEVEAEEAAIRAKIEALTS
jgi:hypothetical protein